MMQAEINATESRELTNLHLNDEQKISLLKAFGHETIKLMVKGNITDGIFRITYELKNILNT